MPVGSLGHAFLRRWVGGPIGLYLSDELKIAILVGECDLLSHLGVQHAARACFAHSPLVG